MGPSEAKVLGNTAKAGTRQNVRYGFANVAVARLSPAQLHMLQPMRQGGGHSRLMMATQHACTCYHRPTTLVASARHLQSAPKAFVMVLTSLFADRCR